MRVPQKIIVLDRWIACLYPFTSIWFKPGWSIRHACGKYAKVDLDPIKALQRHDNLWNAGRIPDSIHTLNRIPPMFGNLMKKKKRRHPEGKCPRCGETVPGGLAIYVTTMAMREGSKE